MKKAWYEDSTLSMPPEGSLLVEARGEGGWEFAFPRLTMTICEYFHDAIDAWETGDVTFTEQRYRQLLTGRSCSRSPGTRTKPTTSGSTP